MTSPVPSPTCTLIIPAAGSGRRMTSQGGPETPKPLIPLNGKPILGWTLEAFASVGSIHSLVLACQAEHSEAFAAAIEASWQKPYTIVTGGDERSDSVKAALQACPDETSIVLIHDAVRPLIRQSSIEASIDTAQQKGCALVAMAARDTLKRVNTNHAIIETVDRSEIVHAQTPQTFQRDLLSAAYARPDVGHFTDDCAVAEAAGHTIHVVPGSADNLKVTTPEDLKLAEYLLQSR